MQNYAHVSSKWSGLTGADHIASLGERERLLMEANCFVFNGTERLLSYFNSSKISSLNLNGKIAFFSKPLEHKHPNRTNIKQSLLKLFLRAF
jgi:hypothetical protein